MLFKVISSNSIATADMFPQVVLRRDNWNDWFRFYTLFDLFYFDKNGNKYNIGYVKIGQYDMSEEKKSPSISDEFDTLDDSFFSLGQDVEYYKKLKDLGDDVRETVLGCLNDVAYDSEVLENALSTRVMRDSLLRGVSLNLVRNQFSRIALGGTILSEYHFMYKSKSTDIQAINIKDLDFRVEPHEYPPTNIHVLIGRNGVGKTYLLNNMIKSLISKPEGRYGSFISADGEPGRNLFSNLVTVSFSAFDNSTPISDDDDDYNFRYHYIGLKKSKKLLFKKVNKSRNDDVLIVDGETDLEETKVFSIKSFDELANDFINSMWTCKITGKISRWIRAITILESDPNFRESDIKSAVNIDKENEFKENFEKKYKALSSGHKIILLTMTKLVETVEEQSLVIIDEPEAHLHPPLLSAFTRALSDLLIQRNGVAIIATHSPVVLQEVPKHCVWKLRKVGTSSVFERLDNETFGESIDALTREVFGLEVTDSGFHKMIAEVVNKVETYQDGLDEFKGKLGFEARVIMKTLFAIKNSKDV